MTTGSTPSTSTSVLRLLMIFLNFLSIQIKSIWFLMIYPLLFRGLSLESLRKKFIHICNDGTFLFISFSSKPPSTFSILALPTLALKSLINMLGLCCFNFSLASPIPIYNFIITFNCAARNKKHVAYPFYHNFHAVNYYSRW